MPAVPFLHHHDDGDPQWRKVMTEIPDDIVAAIKDVVMWSRGCDDRSRGDITMDDILSDAVPRLDQWLVTHGLLPTATHPFVELPND
jgi:hypothetical protein